MRRRTHDYDLTKCTTGDDVSALRLSYYSRSSALAKSWQTGEVAATNVTIMDNDDEDDSSSSSRAGRPRSLPRMTVNNIARASISVLLFLINARCLLQTDGNEVSSSVDFHTYQEATTTQHHNRSLLDMMHDSIDDLLRPKSSPRWSSSQVANVIDGRGGSSSISTNDYPYSVIIISYHKTGHDLQMDLVDYLVNEFHDVGPHLTEFGNKSPVKRRRHPPNVPCARIGKYMETGSIIVQHAPDLFCTPEELLDMLLGQNRDNGERRQLRLDRGVKVVHLVRDPFQMAVSNYHYHAQLPTPESWIQHQDPCDTEYYEQGQYMGNYGDMIAPALSKSSYEALNLKLDGRLLLPKDFDAIRRDCESLYQTKDGLQNANLLTHLLNLDPPEGIRLATSEMMIQGYDNGGDILRMANNIIKLKQAQMKYAQQYQTDDIDNNNNNRGLHIYTMSLDEFIVKPAEAAHRFFDFVLDSKNTVLHDRIDTASRSYWHHYNDKKLANSNHITHDKVGDRDQLKEYLRQDLVFGPTLHKIELLVEAALLDGVS